MLDSTEFSDSHGTFTESFFSSEDFDVLWGLHGVFTTSELLELAEKAQIPVINTLMGVSNFPSNHILYGGWPGMHGMAYSNLILDQADLIVAIGMRFDDRITGNPEKFATSSKKIHMNLKKH